VLDGGAPAGAQRPLGGLQPSGHSGSSASRLDRCRATGERRREASSAGGRTMEGARRLGSSPWELTTRGSLSVEGIEVSRTWTAVPRWGADTAAGPGRWDWPWRARPKSRRGPASSTAAPQKTSLPSTTSWAFRPTSPPKGTWSSAARGAVSALATTTKEKPSDV
jgi:hypothetical protein